MTKPVRIQRKRTGGWKMPANTVYVGRPSKWGNNFSVEKYGRTRSIKHYSRLMARLLKSPSTIGIQFRSDLAKLRGKNLACWCRADQACHADVLLELANRTPPPNEGMKP